MKCAMPVQILQTLLLWEICTPNHILRFELNKQSQNISDGLNMIQSLRKLANFILTSSPTSIRKMWPCSVTDVISDGCVTSIRAGPALAVICVTRTKFIIWPHGASLIDHHAYRIWQERQKSIISLMSLKSKRSSCACSLVYFGGREKVNHVECLLPIAYNENYWPQSQHSRIPY